MSITHLKTPYGTLLVSCKSYVLKHFFSHERLKKCIIHCNMITDQHITLCTVYFNIFQESGHEKFVLRLLRSTNDDAQKRCGVKVLRTGCEW